MHTHLGARALDAGDERLDELLEELAGHGAAHIHIVHEALHVDGGLRIRAQNLLQLQTSKRARSRVAFVLA